jgi:hypothetical protein
MSRGLGEKQRYLLSRLREASFVTIFEATDAYLRASYGDRYYLSNSVAKGTCQASFRRSARELERRGLCSVVQVWHSVPITKVTTERETDPFDWDYEARRYRERLVRRRRLVGYRREDSGDRAT